MSERNMLHRTIHDLTTPLSVYTPTALAALASPEPSPTDAPSSSYHYPLLPFTEDQSILIIHQPLRSQPSYAMAHVQETTRPRPYPLQNVLHVTSDDATGSADSSPNVSPSASVSSPEMARCSRCQRTPSLNIQTGKNNMVEYGLNLWYCSRCAVMVGMVKP